MAESESRFETMADRAPVMVWMAGTDALGDWFNKPWLAFTGDSLLVGDVGRPDLHAGGDPEPQARVLRESLDRLLALPDSVLVFPSHYAGSVCGRSLSGNPFSTIGFERRHNKAVAPEEPAVFARALLEEVPPPPADQAAIVSANRSGRSLASA